MNDYKFLEIQKQHREEYAILKAERDAALAKAARAEKQLEDARIANTVHIADAELYREAEVAKHEAKIAIEERDAALAEVARMRPVVEAAVKALRKIDVDEESDIACYRDEAIELLKGATNG